MLGIITNNESYKIDHMGERQSRDYIVFIGITAQCTCG